MPEPTTPMSTDYYVYEYITNPLSKHLCSISPNTITVINFLMIIPVIYSILFESPLWWLMGLMVFRQIIDTLDGSIARKCQTGSHYGFFLDVTGDLIYHYTIILVLLYKTYSNPRPFPYIRSICLLFIMMYYVYCFIDTIATKKHKTATFVEDNSIFFVALAAILIKQLF